MLPRDVIMLSSVSTQLALPPKDTGTVLGVVERAPQTIYRCLQSTILSSEVECARHISHVRPALTDSYALQATCRTLMN